MLKRIRKKHVNNAALMPEILKFKETGEVSEELAEMLLSMAYRFATKGNFVNYTWTDEMVSDAIFTCLSYLKNFDPDKQKKPNPFAYITTIFKNAFINYIKKQHKHSSIKDICYKRKNCFFDNEPMYLNKGLNYEKLKE